MFCSCCFWDPGKRLCIIRLSHFPFGSRSRIRKDRISSAFGCFWSFLNASSIYPDYLISSTVSLGNIPGMVFFGSIDTWEGDRLRLSLRLDTCRENRETGDEDHLDQATGGRQEGGEGKFLQFELTSIKYQKVRSPSFLKRRLWICWYQIFTTPSTHQARAFKQ